jgi:hypothetical protein
MTPRRLVAIGFIFACTCLGWGVLGRSVVSRTGEFDKRLETEVEDLWGGGHFQVAPEVWWEPSAAAAAPAPAWQVAGQGAALALPAVVRSPGVPLDSGRVNVSLALDPRRRGLLWYATYAVVFHGRYAVRNASPDRRVLHVRFDFPSAKAIYDGFVFQVNGQLAEPSAHLADGIAAQVELEPGAEASIETGYRSRGLGPWLYGFVRSDVTQVRDFSMDMATDFREVDFPPGTLSPTRMTCEGAGCKLSWRFDRLVTGQRIGMDPPKRLNPGPVAARITFFAPVSLLFFITVMVVVGVRRGHSLHPVHYFFLSAAFFAFHLLLAYLVDHLNVHVSFLLAAAISLALVVSYLSSVAGWRLALFEAGAAQLLYLVLFSYAFFFEGYAGLTVTLGAVATLAVLMQLTARVDWDAALRGGE